MHFLAAIGSGKDFNLERVIDADKVHNRRCAALGYKPGWFIDAISQGKGFRAVELEGDGNQQVRGITPGEAFQAITGL